MFPVTITVRNYRCFGEKHPLEYELDRGFTALVGPNDAGKSAALKLFHELRHVWAAIANPDYWRNGHGTQPTGHGLAGVSDPAEIFCEGSSRAMTLDFDFKHPPADRSIRTLRVLAKRPQAGSGFAVELFILRQDSSTGEPRPVVPALAKDARRVDVNIEPITPLFEALRDSMFVPAFRNSINTGGAMHYDVRVGTSFVQQFSEWKGGSSKEQKATVIRLTNRIAELLGFHTLEINPSHDRERIELNVNGNPRQLNEVGSGVSQFILTLISVAIRKPSIVFIDEPELNLHPARQIDLLQALSAITGTGSIVFATHAMGLARSVAERIYVVARDRGENTSRIRPLGDPASGLELIGEMNYSLQAAVGVEALLFVEGVNDVMPIRQFLRAYRKEHRLLVVPMRGAADLHANRSQDWQEMLRLGIPIFALIDSERPSAHAMLEPKRAEFVQMMTKLGHHAKVLDRRAVENYFTNNAVKQVFPNAHSLGEFDPPSSGGWGKADNWQIAPYVSREDLDKTDLGQWLASLLEAPTAPTSV